MSAMSRTMVLLWVTLTLCLAGWSQGGDPSRTISPKHWTNLQVMAAFQGAGLELETIQTGKKEGDDLFANLMPVQSTRFVIPSEQKAEGIIFIFDHAEDLELVRNYYLALDESFPMFGSWLYARDNILLQINKDVPEAEASQYELALSALK